jgi:NADP-dependent 3-hydroxy acid dehydrogenase YdfG
LLVREIASASANALVAYRGSRRWVQILDPASAGLPARLREGGVYLITGGLGNIGLVCASYLAKRARAKLILLGRSEFPAKAEWSRWVETHGTENAVSHKIEKLKSIEALGGEVVVATADVADLRQMAAVVDQVKSRFGGIHGVIHGAGVIGNSFTEIQKIRSSDIDLHFRPKVQGLLVLEKLFREEKLDFWLLHSSISTALGGLGMASYAAANVYMDTLAELRNRQNSTPWISVNWDYWKFDADSDFGKMMQASLNPEKCDVMLSRVLGTDTPGRLIVSAGNIESRLTRWSPPRTADSSLRSSKTAAVNSNLETHTTLAPEQDLERIVADIWKDILGVAAVGADDNFFELGGNSLSAIQVISRMRAVLKADVPMTALIAHPTLAELADVARESLTGGADSQELDRVLSDLEQLSDEEAERLLAEEEQKG